MSEKSKFWLNDISYLFKKANVMPTAEMSLEERLNALTRLLIIFSLFVIILGYHKAGINLLLLGIIVIIIFYLVVRPKKENNSHEEMTKYVETKYKTEAKNKKNDEIPKPVSKAQKLMYVTNAIDETLIQRVDELERKFSQFPQNTNISQETYYYDEFPVNWNNQNNYDLPEDNFVPQIEIIRGRRVVLYKEKNEALDLMRDRYQEFEQINQTSNDADQGEQFLNSIF